MIFVTVGTNEQAFQRLVEAAATLDVGEQVIVQYGSARLRAVPPGWRDYMSFAEMSEMMEQARCVVAHAGVGSILLAHRLGKRPIVMPRRRRLGEAVDDHQVGLAQRLRAHDLVTLVENAADLRLALATSTQHHRQVTRLSGSSSLLATELRQYLLSHGRPRLARCAPDHDTVSLPAAPGIAVAAGPVVDIAVAPPLDPADHPGPVDVATVSDVAPSSTIA